MKQIVFLALILTMLINCVYAQNSDHQAPAPTTGNFEISKSLTVGYTLVTSTPGSIVLHVRPSTTFVLNAHIVDSKGAELMKIEPQSVTGRFVKSVDISKWPSGQYFVEIAYGDNKEKTYRIPFAKG